MTLRRFVGFAVVLVVGLVALGHWSGNQPRLDAVAVAQRETGVALESSRVDVGDARRQTARLRGDPVSTQGRERERPADRDR